MLWFETMLVAFSTYSALPMPQFAWNEKNMRYAICWFPIVGVVCGLGLLLWNFLCMKLGISPVLFAAVAVCLPLLLTGGIHMDGYMDTVDALASHQTRERMLEIMKDSGCGAFAAIYCGIYLLLDFGFLYAIYEMGRVDVLIPMYVLSRGCSALCAVTMPNARKAGMLCAFTENVQKSKAVTVISVILAVTAVGTILYAPLLGSLEVVGAVLAMLWYRHMAKKNFGGVTGDTSGFFLQICELVMVIAVWAGGLL